MKDKSWPVLQYEGKKYWRINPKHRKTKVWWEALFSVVGLKCHLPPVCYLIRH